MTKPEQDIAGCRRLTKSYESWEPKFLREVIDKSDPVQRHVWQLVRRENAHEKYDRLYWCCLCGTLRRDTSWGPVVPVYHRPSLGSVSDDPGCKTRKEAI